MQVPGREIGVEERGVQLCGPETLEQLLTGLESRDRVVLLRERDRASHDPDPFAAQVGQRVNDCAHALGRRGRTGRLRRERSRQRRAAGRSRRVGRSRHRIDLPADNASYTRRWHTSETRRSAPGHGPHRCGHGDIEPPWRTIRRLSGPRHRGRDGTDGQDLGRRIDGPALPFPRRRVLRDRSRPNDEHQSETNGKRKEAKESKEELASTCAVETLACILLPSDICHLTSLAFLGQGEDEQGIPAPRVAEPGGAVAGKPGRPATPADADGDVLPAVEAVGDRAGVVARAALEGPEGLAGLDVVGGEEPFGVAGEDKARRRSPARRRPWGSEWPPPT